MLKNYLLTAWRNLIRNKVFSLIKILGLSIGLTVCMLIFLYTRDELSFDRFHNNKAQLYRIVQDWEIGNKRQSMGITNAVVGETFAAAIPEVQQSVRLKGVTVTVKRNDNLFNETPLFVDDNYLSVFTFPLLDGNSKTALTDPHSLVLSESMAKKYFGSTEVIGKTLQIKTADTFEGFTVTAVTAGTPQNSTLQAEMLLPLNYYEKYNSNKGWFGGSLHTFVLLAPGSNKKLVETKMQGIFYINIKDKLQKAQAEQGTTVKISLSLQPLVAIHLSKEAGPDNGMAAGSSPLYAYLLSCIAVFILVIACINFINLAVAQSLKRSREIGIRKVMGSSRTQLIFQFLTESFLVSLVAFLLAICLAAAILPFFNQLADKKLSISYLSGMGVYIFYLALLIVTSFIAGFYPSLVLSGFQPVRVLYNMHSSTGKNYLKNGLIVLQFTMAIFLITCTIAVVEQLNFLERADLGYDSRNLVRIDIPVSNASEKLPGIFKNELASEPNVLGIAAKNDGRSTGSVQAGDKIINTERNKIDDRFFSVFKIPVLAGRGFSPVYTADSLHSVVVNESFVKAAGWNNSAAAIGKTVGRPGDKRLVSIVGVIKDYHFLSLKEKITPAIYTMNPDFNFGQIWIRIKPTDIAATLAMLERTYKKIVPYYPYSYQFMNEVNAQNYAIETKWKQIISVASGLFVFLSCIGLFGLVILSVQQRRKEIGIRKVLGAAVSRIVLLVSGQFIVAVIIAFFIAAPASYFAISKWLEGFAYRINIEWWVFACSGSIVITVALLTLSSQAIKAASANPAKSLKTD